MICEMKQGFVEIDVYFMFLAAIYAFWNGFPLLAASACAAQIYKNLLILFIATLVQVAGKTQLRIYHVTLPR